MHVEGVTVRQQRRRRALETAFRWQTRLMTWLRHHPRVAAIMELLAEAASWVAGWWPYH
jgi:hypothetical protein